MAWASTGGPLACDWNVCSSYVESAPEKATRMANVPRHIRSCPQALSMGRHKDDEGGICPLLCGNHVVFVEKPGGRKNIG